VLRRPELHIREITRSSSFAKIRITRKLDDERAIWHVPWFTDDVQHVLLSTNDAQLVLGFTDDVRHVQWFTDDASVSASCGSPTTSARTVADRCRQHILWSTDAAPRILWFTDVLLPDVSDAHCGEKTVPLTTPSQQAVVASGLMCVPPS